MKTLHSPTSVCRRCRYYQPEGRRGGYCQQLDVTVQGAWSACALATPPFSPTWENFEDIMLWQQKTLAAIEESVLIESLETNSCRGETIEGSQTLGDRVYSEHGFGRAALNQITQPSTEPKQTIGIQALWT